MQYKELVDQVADQTGYDPKIVRDVLSALPDALIELNEGEQVRVPFGVFRMTKRVARSVFIPTSDDEVHVPEALVVKLKAGTRLRRQIPLSE